MKEKQEKKYTDLVDVVFIECLKDLRDLYDESGYSEFIIKHDIWCLGWGLYREVIINENRIYLYCPSGENPLPDSSDFPSKTIDLEKRRYNLLNGKLKKTKFLSGSLTVKEEFIDCYDCIRQKFANEVKEKDVKAEKLDVKIKQLKKGSC